MGALIHFIFTLVKILVLASFYAMILFFAFRQIGKTNPGNWFQRITANQKKFWIRSGAIISMILFIWGFTYWGNHGAGDYARIPIGNGYAVENINWTEYGYLEEVEIQGGKNLDMTRFSIKNNKIIGNLDSWFYHYDKQYFLLDLKTEEVIEFENGSELDKFAEKNNLPKAEELKSFKRNYQEYWSGWRFWFLP